MKGLEGSKPARPGIHGCGGAVSSGEPGDHMEARVARTLDNSMLI